MKIIIKPSCLAITDYNLGDCKKLEDLFRVYDPISHKYNVVGMYYEAKSKTLFIPKGLNLWQVENYLGLTSNDEIRISPAEYEPTVNILMKYKPRDEEQRKALRFMLGLDEYERYRYESQLSVNLNTGKGKTYCSVATIAFLKIKSIVVTGTTSLLKQWQDNIKEYTNLSDEDVLFISGSPMMSMILNNKSKKARDASIFLCTHSTIKSFCDQYGWDKLQRIFDILGIGLKFIDEAHTNFANMLMMDFYSNVYKTYYVTATPERSNWQENNIYQMSFQNVKFIDLFNPDIDPHTDYIAIKYNSKPTRYDIEKCRNAYGLDRNKYIDYITHNENFYMVMRIIMDMYLRCNGRGLFYIGTNEGILRVYKWIGENYPQLLGQIGIYTSIVSQEEKAEMKKKRLILSTTKSAGLGEHIDHLKMTVVVAEPFKSEVLTRQTLGRTRDDNTIYLELVDLGFKQLRKFYYSKLHTLNRYAKSVSDTTIDQYELENRSSILEEKQEEKIKHSPIVFCDPRFFHYTNNELNGKT